MTALTLNSARIAAHRFAKDESGAIAILFGLMFTAFLGVVGVAIDVGRAIHTDQRLTAALDSAALAAGRALIDGQLTEAEIEALALKRLDENFTSGGNSFGTLSNQSITLNRATGAVTINSTATVEAAMTGFLGFDKFTMPRQVAVIFDQKDIELGIQLDITGSMSGQKLKDLKRALNGDDKTAYNKEPEHQGLFDILLPPEKGTNRVRIGLAPYSAGVNLGPAKAALVTNNRNAGSGCVYDRIGSTTSDDYVGSGSYYRGRADLGGVQPCPTTGRVIPLSAGNDNDKEREALKDAVDLYQAGGTTAGQLGSNWAWNLISNNWKDLWALDGSAAPVPYGTPNTLKAVILMTDGEYNTVDGQCDTGGCTPYGPRGTKSNKIARELCEKMRGEDVIVYTIGFQLNHPVALETLRQCTTDVTKTHFEAQNGEQLQGAFRNIAQQLTNLRLTQ